MGECLVGRIAPRQARVVDHAVVHVAAAVRPRHRGDERVEQRVGSTDQPARHVDPARSVEGDPFPGGVRRELRFTEGEEGALVRRHPPSIPNTRSGQCDCAQTTMRWYTPITLAE